MSHAIGQIVCDLVHIAPAPVLAGFNGPDHWMMQGMEVLSGVLIFGRIAATDMAAGETDSQMYPSVAGFHAIFTNMAGRLEITGLLEMTAGLHAKVDARKRKEASEKCNYWVLCWKAASHLMQSNVCPINRARPSSLRTQGLSVHGGLWRTWRVCPHSKSATQSPNSSW